MHRLQVLSYLKTLDLGIRLLINFDVPVLKMASSESFGR